MSRKGFLSQELIEFVLGQMEVRLSELEQQMDDLLFRDRVIEKKINDLSVLHHDLTQKGGDLFKTTRYLSRRVHELDEIELESSKQMESLQFWNRIYRIGFAASLVLLLGAAGIVAMLLMTK